MDSIDVMNDRSGFDDEYLANITCPVVVDEPTCWVPPRHGRRGGRGGGRGRGPPGGRGLRLFGGEEGGFGNSFAGGRSEESEPKEGNWVCRTLYHHITGEAEIFSACVDTEHAIITDECGCCGEVCPDVCTCECDDISGPFGDFSTGGVLITVESDDEDDEENPEICVPTEHAVSLIAKSQGRVSCVEICA